MPEAYDWTAFDLYFYYHAPLDEVWRAWSTIGGLCRFFIETCSATRADGTPLGPDDPFEPGTRYDWKWRHGYPAKGEFTSVEAKRALSLTFGGMKVRIELLDTGSAVRVHLRQYEIPTSEEDRVMNHMNCRSCWIFFMTNLVSVLQSGRDLRDADPKRVSSMEVGFRPAE